MLRSAALVVVLLLCRVDGLLDKLRPRTPSPVLFCPAQLSVGDDYGDFFTRLEEEYGHSVTCADLRRTDWLRLAPSIATPNYWQGTLTPQPVLDFYFEALDRAIDRLQGDYPEGKINVVAHSLGGWIARAYLAERCPKAFVDRVATFTSLGTPHVPPPPDSLFSGFEQTRGLLTYVNDKYPGAYLPGVTYTSVLGVGVKGALPWQVSEDDAATPSAIESLVGFASYLPLSGRGEDLGDGIVPESIGILPGSEPIFLPGVKHADFLPSFPRSVRLDELTWYGSADVVPKWVSALA
mmetsp:Transcript_3197/g.9187  ORF Transcript_3197/g.9187 Transcript_3197/m.9187 type:complete len:294 (-) Transcript_3197:83-964(-)